METKQENEDTLHRLQFFGCFPNFAEYCHFLRETLRKNFFHSTINKVSDTTTLDAVLKRRVITNPPYGIVLFTPQPDDSFELEMIIPLTQELFAAAVSRQLWFPLFCISIAYSLSWFLGIKLCLLIIGLKVTNRKIYLMSLIGALYSFWARQLLPLPLVGIGLPILLALLVWFIARGLHPLKYCWAALTMMVFTFLGGTIFECTLSFANPRIGSFLLQTAWGCVVGTAIENIGPILGLLLLPRILPKLKTSLNFPVESQPDRLEFSTLIIYFAIYCSTFFTSMLTYFSLLNGYPHSLLFLMLQLITAFTTVVFHYHYKGVKKIGSENTVLIIEKARLEEVKKKLEADKAKLEADKAELLKELRKYAGANHIEAALKTQRLDEIFNEFMDRVQNIYNPLTEEKDTQAMNLKSDLTLKPFNKARYKLTPREVLILKGIVAGKMNKEIADEVFLVEGTVTNHITKLFRRFGVRNREELARYAVENDLIDMK
jgi:DNA-binding CsgD family transcriptional regulator